MAILHSVGTLDTTGKFLGISSQAVVWIVSLLGAMAVVAPAAAQETSELVVGVSGELVSPKQYTLTVEPGSVADRAIRVYSEPSHTFLLLVLDSKLKGKADLSSWEESITSTSEPRATTVTSLPLGRPRVTIQPPPEDDFAISVWVYGTWPDGTIEDRIVAEAKVDLSEFETSTYHLSDPVAKGGGPGQQQHCCSSACCPQKCVPSPVPTRPTLGHPTPVSSAELRTSTTVWPSITSSSDH
jgi:hypothetical protein